MPHNSQSEVPPRCRAYPSFEQALDGKLWLGRGLYYSSAYAYVHYHSMTMASEISWEESGVLRLYR